MVPWDHCDSFAARRHACLGKRRLAWKAVMPAGNWGRQLGLIDGTGAGAFRKESQAGRFMAILPLEERQALCPCISQATAPVCSAWRAGTVNQWMAAGPAGTPVTDQVLEVRPSPSVRSTAMLTVTLPGQRFASGQQSLPALPEQVSGAAGGTMLALIWKAWS